MVVFICNENMNHGLKFPSTLGFIWILVLIKVTALLFKSEIRLHVHMQSRIVMNASANRIKTYSETNHVFMPSWCACRFFKFQLRHIDFNTCKFG